MTEERQSWVWITKKEYYFEEDGTEAAHLDPSSGIASDGSWWTCHPDTRAGDLVLLYRTAPMSDVAYLLEASTDAKLLGTSAHHDVVTLPEFEKLLALALAKEADPDSAPFDRRAVQRAQDQFDEALAEEQRAHEALRRYDWRLGDLHQARSDHEQEELALGDRERQEGLDNVQAEWDRWSAQDEALTLVEGHRDYPDTAAKLRLNLAYEVFAALDMPYETTLETDPKFKGRWVCGWEPRYKFTSPIPIGTFGADGWLAKTWNALRANFKGSFFKFEPDVWERVIATAASDGNPDLPSLVEQYSRLGPSDDIVSEHQIRDALARSPKALGINGLKVYVSPMRADQNGVEYTCPGVGFIDLLMTDGSGDFVVVELKTKRAGEPVIGQIAKYMGWVKQNLANGRAVRGVVVSNGYDAKYEAAATMLDLTHIEVSDVKARLGL